MLEIISLIEKTKNGNYKNKINCCVLSLFNLNIKIAIIFYNTPVVFLIINFKVMINKQIQNYLNGFNNFLPHSEFKICLKKLENGKSWLINNTKSLAIVIHTSVIHLHIIYKYNKNSQNKIIIFFLSLLVLMLGY